MLNALLTFARNYPSFALLIVTAIGCVLIPGIRGREVRHMGTFLDTSECAVRSWCCISRPCRASTRFFW